jgi:hypothetical protein
VFVEQAVKERDAASAQNAEATVPENAGDSSPAFQSVVLDGVAYNTEDELREAVMLKADYTRKTMETAVLKHRLEEQLGQGESGRPVQGPGDLWIGEDGVERNQTGAGAPGGLQDAVRPEPRDTGQPEGAPNGRALSTEEDDDDVPTRADMRQLREDIARDVRQEIKQTVGADAARRARAERLARWNQDIAESETRLPGYTAAVEAEIAAMQYSGDPVLAELTGGSKAAAYAHIYMTRVAPKVRAAPSHVEGGVRTPPAGDTGPLADVIGPDDREGLIAHMRRGGRIIETE